MKGRLRTNVALVNKSLFAGSEVSFDSSTPGWAIDADCKGVKVTVPAKLIDVTGPETPADVLFLDALSREVEQHSEILIINAKAINPNYVYGDEIKFPFTDSLPSPDKYTTEQKAIRTMYRGMIEKIALAAGLHVYTVEEKCDSVMDDPEYVLFKLSDTGEKSAMISSSYILENAVWQFKKAVS